MAYHKDTPELQRLSALSSGLDRDRPPEDRIVELFFGALTQFSTRTNTYLPHSDLIYCRAALEAKFGRIFSLQEVKDLIKEVYGVKYA